MSISRVLITLIAFLIGGWLCFDGLRAMIVGDYITPRSGAGAGKLGPWANVVLAVGLEPRGTFVKCLHVILGAVWLISLIAFVARPGLGWWALAASSMLSLWYLPLGTLLSVIELTLLFLPHIRSLK